MSDHLEAAFPGLQSSEYQVTSPADPTYNCIAWALGKRDEWWWPRDAFRRTVWPERAPLDVTIESFVAAFSLLGFTVALDERVERGFEKLALFASADGIPTHVARQLPSGRWTSKLGQSEDIEHELGALQGQVYGSAVVILNKPTARNSG